MKRNLIISQLIEEQGKVVESLQQSVNQYKTASDMDEESTHDPEDFSHQTEAKDMQLRFEKMLAEAEENLNFLTSEQNAAHETIEKGSVIETDQSYLFVGISVPVFKIEGKDVISFSEEAPVFEEIKGKTNGDSFRIGDNSHVIQSIA
ncbi:MAG: hypothetical protein ACXWVZ_05240 [Kaistella sp.]